MPRPNPPPLSSPALSHFLTTHSHSPSTLGQITGTLLSLLPLLASTHLSHATPFHNPTFPSTYALTLQKLDPELRNQVPLKAFIEAVNTAMNLRRGGEGDMYAVPGATNKEGKDRKERRYKRRLEARYTTHLHHAFTGLVYEECFEALLQYTEAMNRRFAMGWDRGFHGMKDMEEREYPSGSMVLGAREKGVEWGVWMREELEEEARGRCAKGKFPPGVG